MTTPQTVRVIHEGRTFVFQIYSRNLQLGRAGEAKYYWMDGRQLRRGRGGPNFRPCVDIWWHAVEQAGDAGEIENQIDLVFAECYPLVATAKSLQNVYIDAHLHATADREYSYDEEASIRRRRSDRTYLLPEEECQRLYAIAQSHDPNQVRHELENLFMGVMPPQNEMSVYREAAQMWLGNGLTALRRGGREELQQYTQEIDHWIRRLRRIGNLDRERTFLNLFSYECKVSFYRCYCSAWVGITQQLAQTEASNVLGSRLMQLWHSQNQGGYNGENHRDVFCGQILALHPLSAVVLTSPAHLEVLGRWFGHPNYDAILASGTIDQCDEYWNVVATILIAAHEYAQSRQRWEERRGQTTRPNNNTAIAEHARDDAVGSARMLFEEYIAARGQVCSECSAHLSYLRHELATTEEQVIVHFQCSACGLPHAREISYEDLTS